MPMRWGAEDLERLAALAEGDLPMKVKARANTAMPMARRKINEGITGRYMKRLLFSLRDLVEYVYDTCCIVCTRLPGAGCHSTDVTGRTSNIQGTRTGPAPYTLK